MNPRSFHNGKVTLDEARLLTRKQRYRLRQNGVDVPSIPRRCGYKQTSEHIAKRIKSGPDHHCWSGESTTVRNGRKRALKMFPVVPLCEGCGKSESRFLYTSKADHDDRLRSRHPTVKPVDLMQWLIRLVCPKGAIVLDLFAGTGTTGAAAFIEGRRCVLIEREAEYLADIERRMGLLLSGPDERARKLAKPEPYESLPLFGAA